MDMWHLEKGVNLVPGARLELARSKAPRDFKSLVSTNSTTRAQCKTYP